jgi:hypothetical protein
MEMEKSCTSAQIISYQVSYAYVHSQSQNNRKFMLTLQNTSSKHVAGMGSKHVAGIFLADFCQRRTVKLLAIAKTMTTPMIVTECFSPNDCD